MSPTQSTVVLPFICFSTSSEVRLFSTRVICSQLKGWKILEVTAEWLNVTVDWTKTKLSVNIHVKAATVNIMTNTIHYSVLLVPLGFKKLLAKKLKINISVSCLPAGHIKVKPNYSRLCSILLFKHLQARYKQHLIFLNFSSLVCESDVCLWLSTKWKISKTLTERERAWILGKKQIAPHEINTK